jgi:hypothetical protein
MVFGIFYVIYVIRADYLSTAMENALSALRGEVPKYVKNTEVIDTWLSRFGKGSR